MNVIDRAIERIRTFEPKEGYFLAFSGGKDSQCIYELAKMAGVKFEAHYHITSVDPPELYYFIRDQYPDVIRDRPLGKDGKQINMWKLIEQSRVPPVPWARYCCEELKEPGGKGKLVMTGVRWEESTRRSRNHGVVTVTKPGKTIKRILAEIDVGYDETPSGGIVLNLDNGDMRRPVEMCYRSHKTILNPIVDWAEEEVWHFLNDVAKVPHCCLYDEGYRRLGCIGCPLQGHKGMKKDFERYPRFKDLYLRSFARMLENHPGTRWTDAEDVMRWWLQEEK